MFEISKEAAAHNSNLLANCEFDFGSFLKQRSSTTVKYGSEFCPISQLALILGRHPNFPKLCKILQTGMDYRFASTILEEDRRKEASAMVIWGNHKSAESRTKQVQNALSKDVLHGFLMPISATLIPSIPGAMVQPLGMAKQLALTKSGERVPKF
jgi:hypothetical protein